MRGLYVVFIVTRKLVVLTRPEDIKVRLSLRGQIIIGSEFISIVFLCTGVQNPHRYMHWAGLNMILYAE